MNSIQKRTEKRDNAVSPVVGVMLMLVVTIIITAVVASFAGGLVTNTEATPVASLDVNIYSVANVGGTMSSTYAPDFTIDHLSGDPLSTADLRITFTWTNSTGHTFRSVYNGAGDVNFTETFTSYPGYNSSMYLNDLTVGSPAFGDAVLTVGSHLQTGANNLYQDYFDYGGNGTTIVHKGSQFMDDLIGRDISSEFTPIAEDAGTSAAITDKGVMELLPVGTGVHVTITHIPNGKAIYDKVVYVQ
ncbi:type IV pilin N-terminal domain-containing protein [uncultured Methanocorpusculum sp.]|nr:type IV pilin N-terminal domain-containing protein [uncultured Methanocorpusculum sp.]